MGYEEPLLFVNSPVIVKHVYVPQIEEESTSVFEPEIRQLQETSATTLASEKSAVEKSAVDPRIRQISDYLASPFRRELYQPLEFLAGEQIVKGKILEVQDSALRIEETKSGIITDLSLDEVTDIRWKEQSFIP